MKNRSTLIQSLIFSTIFLLLNINSVQAQDEFLFEHISVSDGLSSSRINVFQSIFQDEYGYMWFGTVDGLNRYDGFNFKIYKNIPGDSTSLPSSNIQLIGEDPDGNLWVGTNGFMSLLDRKTDAFNNYPIESINTTGQQKDVFRTLVDSKKNFWISTTGSGVQRWNKELKKFEIIPFLINISDSLTKVTNTVVIAFSQLRNGNILAANFSGGIYFYNEDSNAFEKYNVSGLNNYQGIVDIFEDKTGNIWFSGRNIFSSYNPITQSLKIIDDWKNLNNSPQEVFLLQPNEIDNGNIFVIAIGIGLIEYVPTSEKFRLVELSGELKQRGLGKFPVSKYLDRFGVYWLGQGDDGIIKFDPKRKPMKTYPLVENKNQSDLFFVSSLTTDRKDPDEIVIGTDTKGIFKFNLRTKKAINLDIPIKSLYGANSNLRDIVFDDNDQIWFFNSRTDLSSYNLKTRKTKTYPVADTRSQTGTGQLINSLNYLQNNKILLGGADGVKIFNALDGEMENLPSIGNREYDEKIKTKVTESIQNNKTLVSLTKVGESANLSKRFTLKNQTELLVVCLGEGTYPNGMFDYGSILNDNKDTLWSMKDLSQTFYGGGGLKNRLQIEVKSLEAGNYTANFQTDIGHSYGNFNVLPPQDSTWYGIQVIELDHDRYVEIKSLIDQEKKKKDLADYFGTDLIIKSKKFPGTIWIGAGSAGLIKYDLTSGRYRQYRPETMKNAAVQFGNIFEDSKGILWIVFNPSGFMRFNPENETYISNSNIPELPQAAINSIIEDFDNNLWISSSVGITKLIRPGEGEKWTTTKFDSKDGVPGGFITGSLISPNGEILLGTINGVTAFYPSSENLTPPLPIISNLSISDVSVFDKNSSLKLDKSIYQTDEINLSYAQNYISFEFEALHYSRPSKNRVLYKLEGLNKDWVYSDRDYVSYTNLEPGEYTFRVKAISGYGVESQQDRHIKISIAPPWYRTIFAYIGYFLSFVGIVFLIDRVQRRRLLSKTKERMKIQEAEHRAEAAELQARALHAESERKTKELEEARQLQLSMLPKQIPQLPNLNIAVYMKTATEVGGDYYDFHLSMDGMLTVVLGDATGHGMRAGTMVTSTKSLFNAMASNNSIVHTFHEMTRCLKLMQLDKLSMCMTMLKIHNRKLIMSSAGMPPVYIFKNKHKIIEEHLMEGMPLGTMDNFPYELKETELFPGDTIFLMSDGFPELNNQDNQMFGYKRARNSFEEVAEKDPEEIISYLNEVGSRWTNKEEPDDDVTFVVIKVK